jgi:transcriptional regulator with XRE-family HTH domain
MNETLRQAMFRAGLSEEAVAAELGVDPKTIRRWLEGRRPYPRLRWQLACLLGTDELELWPGLSPANGNARRPAEVVTVYARRSLLSDAMWHDVIGSATLEVAILDRSGVFIAGNARLVPLLRARAVAGARVRLALSEPGGHRDEQPVDDADGETTAPGVVFEVQELYRPVLEMPAAEMRFHRGVVPSSLLIADDEIFVHQHIYGVTAAESPVLHLHGSGLGELTGAYRDSFEQVWNAARPLRGA